MRVLVVNAGSSSVKLSVLDGDGAVEAQESVEPAAAGEALGRLLGERPDTVGHRVVHGGARFTGPTLVDDDVLAGIDELRVLAPLHQGPAVDALSQAREALPGVPQVACFDTAFHHTIPPAAATYAIPRQWRQELGVRRYGFHGLAHDWSSGRAAEIVGRPVGELRTVTAHLGSGASLCAVDRGRSVDTTMGFTPTAGLVMGTRSGDLDPAVPTYLVRRGVDPVEVADALDRRSGRSRSPVRPTCATWWRRPTTVTAMPPWPWTSGPTGPADWSRRWPPRWAGSTCSRSAEGWGNDPRACGHASSTVSGSSAWRSTPAATRPSTGTRTSGRAWPGRWSSPHGRTRSSPDRCAHCWGSPRYSTASPSCPAPAIQTVLALTNDRGPNAASSRP